jgi:hypothetical protein
MDEIENVAREPIGPELPDPVLADILSGASVRELSAARDDLCRARTRYADAVERPAPPRSHGVR